MLQNPLSASFIILLGALLQAADAPAQAADETAAPASKVKSVFETDVLPILKSKCFTCHDDKVQKSELNLSTPMGVKNGSTSGAILVAGRPDDSLLIEVLHDGLMPPPGEGTPLSPAEVDVLRTWIASGAHFADADLAAQPAVTEADVGQIMRLRCTVCHNGRFKEGGLDLRSRSGMLTGGKSGPAINLKKPAESLLLKKIHAGEMPPLRKLASASVKVIDKAEVALVTKWIELGAPPAPVSLNVDTGSGDSEVTATDRQFWSFQSPRPQTEPEVINRKRVRNPIDSFILQKLEAVGLSLSPDADRRTLIRRAHFDLIGLPPTPECVESFVQDEDPNAYANMIETLLASPHYGERWGRYWLDLAGYSDSDGVNAEDPIRPYAFRYRDYVIRSFNQDKPYDRFLMQQIAGDELSKFDRDSDFNEEIYDNLVATGFLRMAPDGTYNGLTNFVPDRLEVISSEIDILTSSVMGLTVKCAKCHAHKFDPIPHRDYYRLASIFKGAYDENDWMRPAKADPEFPIRGLKFVPPEEVDTWKVQQERIGKELKVKREFIEERQKELVARQLEKHLADVPEVMREDVRAAAMAPRDKLTEIQKYLTSKFEKTLHISLEELQELYPDFKEVAELTFKQIKLLKDEQQPNEPFIQALWDRGEPTPTHVLRRGNYLSPGKEVEPGVPTVLLDERVPYVVEAPWEGAKQTGRRLAFARWLVNANNPLTSRVMVNRIWKHHFGNGIVKSLDNFGRAGQRPTHPELLDWLAIDFVRQGWSIKSMHRLIMNSSTYRQTSQITDGHLRIDLDNRLLSRSPLRRLEAEVLRDSLLFVAGKLDEKPFGPAEKVERRDDGLVTSVGTENGWRRSIYVLQRRSQTSTILEDFDLPQMAPNCVERSVATVAPQALHLLNNKMIHEWATAMAQRLMHEFPTDRNARIGLAYQLALGRQPDAAEFDVTLKSFDEFRERWLSEFQAPKSVQTDGFGQAVPTTVDSSSIETQVQQKALTNLCHALMNSAEFIYVD